MRPFRLDPEDLLEIFKKDFQSENGKWSTNWPAGLFDYQLSTIQSLSKPESETLCDWLATNCTENFIVLKDTTEALAGGHSNNKLAWDNRRKRGYKQDRTSTEFKIRLDQKDIMLFRMVWVSG